MLRLERLSKRYGDQVAIEDVSFDVEPGQIVGFVGPNGAGKTTTMRIVLGVLAADRGEVRWNGAPLDPESRRRIGYMPEERGLYPKMRCGEQLSYFAQLHGLGEVDANASAERWLGRLGVDDRAADPVEELSLGNQQRVQLAAALVHGPDLLVLDEPFSGLDPVGVEVLSEVLIAEARERELPVIFSSHQLELVERLCDAVTIIKDGSLVASGEVEALRESRARNQWDLQLEGDAEWEPGMDGVRRIDAGVYELDDGVDPQTLLDRARGTGRVTLFGRRRATLAELFREVIADDSEASGAAER